MVKDCLTVWDNCLQTIRRNVNGQSFKTWFEPIRPVRLDNAALTIQVPNKFFYEWLEEHYVALLKMTIRKELGDRGRLEYQILTSNSNGQKNHLEAVGAEKEGVAMFNASNKNSGNYKSSGRGVAPGGLIPQALKIHL